MEKATTILAILTHNYEFMWWFWGLVTLPVGFWHLFYFPAKKQLSQKELVEISSGYQGINSGYIIYSIVALFLIIGIPLLVLAPGWHQWAEQNYGLRFYPAIVFFTAGYGIYQGLFALVTGVYPMTRYLSYAYDEPAKIRRIALRHILASVFAIIFVVFFFFVTV